MTQVQLIRDEMTTLLTKLGVCAMSAFPEEARKRHHVPVTLVSIKEFQSEGMGFQNYLGDRFCQESQSWEEIYGQKTAVRFGLDIYSPRSHGERGCQEMMDALAEALGKEAPAGMSAKELSWGNISYDRSCDMFCRSGEALYEGVLYAVTDQDGSFLSFEVRGGITLE